MNLDKSEPLLQRAAPSAPEGGGGPGTELQNPAARRTPAGIIGITLRRAISVFAAAFTLMFLASPPHNDITNWTQAVNAMWAGGVIIGFAYVLSSINVEQSCRLYLYQELLLRQRLVVQTPPRPLATRFPTLLLAATLVLAALTIGANADGYTAYSGTLLTLTMLAQAVNLMLQHRTLKMEEAQTLTLSELVRPGEDAARQLEWLRAAPLTVLELRHLRTAASEALARAYEGHQGSTVARWCFRWYRARPEHRRTLSALGERALELQAGAPPDEVLARAGARAEGYFRRAFAALYLRTCVDAERPRDDELSRGITGLITGITLVTSGINNLLIQISTGNISI